MPTLNVTKQVSCSYASPGGRLYYQITIENPAEDYYATLMTLADGVLSDYFDGLEYSVDGGVTWQAWTGSLEIEDLPPESSGSIIITGIVKAGTIGIINNSASVEVTFCHVSNGNEEVENA